MAVSEISDRKKIKVRSEICRNVNAYRFFDGTDTQFAVNRANCNTSKYNYLFII